MTIRPTATSKPRELGAVYTPEPIVRFMLRSCLESVDSSGSEPLRLLDPACGDGVFLIGAMDERQHCELRTPLQLCGVDIDPLAIDAVQRRLLQTPVREPSCITTNAFCGDALTGRGLCDEECDPSEGFNWRWAFPEAAAAGGFDVVIGNPPYLRERDAKLLFDRLAGTPLGRRWRQPRMDLWHYFLHRGLDLLKPGGVLAFILNSYWTSASSARVLIDRLQQETTIERILLLGDAPIFPGVTGHHMILQLRKGRTETDCRIVDLSRFKNPLPMLSRAGLNGGDAPDDNLAAHEVSRTQQSLYSGGRLIVARSASVISLRDNVVRLGERYLVRQGIAENPPFVTRRMETESDGALTTGTGVFVLTMAEVESLGLTDVERRLLRPYFVTASIGRFRVPKEPTHWLLYLTRSTAPGPGNVSDFQSSHHARDVGLIDFVCHGCVSRVATGLTSTPLGDVLAPQTCTARSHCRNGSGTPKSTELLKLPHPPRDGTVRRILALETSLSLGALITRSVMATLSPEDQTGLPNIMRHLQRFRITLDRRREVRQGGIEWWQLHWPRRETLFTQPGVLAVQMGRRPTFAYAEAPTFVGFSVNLIQQGDAVADAYSLPALTALLNSAPAAGWFQQHAKHRGVNLDISGTVLKDFPLPPFDAHANQRLTHLGQASQTSKQANVTGQSEADRDRVIDAIAESLYQSSHHDAGRR